MNPWKSIQLKDLPTWDQRYYALAQHVAQWSKDPSTKVGAVLVGQDPRDLAVGYNGFPRKIRDLPERLTERSVKYALTQHAERNTLDNARFITKEGGLYVTSLPCPECAKSIVSRELARVVCSPPPEYDSETGKGGWAKEIQWTFFLFREAGIELVIVEQKVPHPQE